jgi:diguanylate cyclase (GGDEF)-like protein/PAS domain S-box-containing protein
MSKKNISNDNPNASVSLHFALKENSIRALKVSPEIKALLGYDAGDFISSKLRFADLVHTDDQDLVDTLFAFEAQKTANSINLRFRHASGKIICLQVCYQKHPDSSSGAMLLSVQLNDAKTLKQTLTDQVLLANFTAMMENSDDYMFFKDRNHVFTGASQTLVKLTDPTEHWTDLIGLTDYDVFPEAYADNYYRLEKQVFSGQVSVSHEVQPTLDNSGRQGWVDNRKYPIKDKSGTIIGLFGIARDITASKLLEEVLKQNEQHFRDLFEHSPDPCWILIENKIVACNAAAVSTLGYQNKTDLLSLQLANISPKYQPDGSLSLDKAKQMTVLALQGEINRFEWEHQRLDGSCFPVEVTLARMDISGQQGVYAIWRDISERKQTEHKLRLTAQVFENVLEGILVTDLKGTIIDVNPAFSELTGYPREEVLGKNASLLKSEQQNPKIYKDMWAQLMTNKHWRGEIWNRKKNGDVFAELLTISAITDSKDKVSHYVGIFSDITDKKKHQLELEKIAHFDPLTGVPNRVLLADRLHQALAHHQRTGKTLAICYLDLDSFKPINDTLGHEAGDILLKKISQRLIDAVRSDDTVARIGGDEFVLLMGDFDDTNEYELLLHRLINSIAEPCQIMGKNVQVTASIGVTFYPSDSADADLLLRHADQAMYIAKTSGKSRYHIFDPSIELRKNANADQIDKIRQALRNREIVIYYQPQVDCRQGKVVGMEALLRWQHPLLGLRLPADFLPAIEHDLLIIRMGEWVIEQALKQLQQWSEQGLELTISVNIAAKQLLKGDFVSQMQELFQPYPQHICSKLKIEVTETTVLDDLFAVSDLIEQCRRQFHVEFALDDFGTGYSTLVQLKKMSANEIKIDRSFIADILHDSSDLAIVNGIISLAEAFHQQVVAEGVETIEQLLLLLELGCDIIQGYCLARPMPVEQATAWLQGFQADPRWKLK